ncbi:hypothetical protein OU800_14810 [Pseudomonas sp. GOM7]|uniref:hypothetical protein n=1 Tax=unclassified Pseudomonas TaxID=196821 RepID=UPI00227CBD58|nr:MULTISPECIES: hypothetical protein [unclassified Pseudomonas]WAJ35891.1 hypothetical protein OU800_14810 [Pseudomonas sp. GOM7]
MMKVLSGLAALVLLTASILLSLQPEWHTPLGATLLFVVGLCVSLSFLLFGRMRFDELLATPPEETQGHR